MKKQRKKIVAIVMCIAMLVCLMPGIQAKAVTQSSVTGQLNSMINQYVNKTASSSQMYMGSQCKGFANWVFKQLFGVYIGPYPENANYKITNANAGLVGMIDPGGLTESSAKALLQKAKPGDYIQVQRSIAKSGGKCGPHSMIVVGVKLDGVQVFDCNSDGRNTIKTYLYTWSKFDYDNRAMSLYHAYGYQEDGSGGSGSTNLPDTRLHVWFSLEPMGNEANSIRLRDMVYLCYRLETTDGRLLDSSIGDYRVKETLYFPDGSTVPHTYEKSNNNWIRSNFDQWGTYRGVVEISGDYTGKVEVSHTIEKPEQVLFNAWFSSAKMGSDVSYLEKGKIHYLCYSITYGDSGYLNKYVNMNYSVKQTVYDPNGKKVYEWTYDNSDNNWISFTPTQNGNYKGVITITGDLNADNSVVRPCKDTTVAKPVQLQSISITKQPQRLSYTVGEQMNTYGMVVTAKYSDGKTKAVSNYKASGSTNQVGQSKVTVSYTENGITKTTYYMITVKEKAVPLETAVISYNPVGGSLSRTSQTGIKNSYVTLLTEQPYKIVKVTFDSNGGDRTPNQMTLQQRFVGWYYNTESGIKWYSSGSRFLLKENCTLKAYYDKAVIKALPDVQRNGYRFDGWYTSNNVKVYVGMSLENDLKLTAHWVKELQSISITKQPQKTSYTVGEQLNTAGMTVVAKYGDGKTKTVSNYKVSGSTNKAGQSKVTVSYTENGITKTAYYTIVVKEKAIPKETIVLSYNPNGGSLSQTSQTGIKNSYVTLLAEQPYKTIKVTFDANGGDRTPNQMVLQQKFVGWLYNTESGLKCYSSGSQFLLKESCTLTAYYEKAVLGTLPDVQRSGYRFDGWYTSGNVRAYAGMGLKNDLKLTAQWVKEESKDNIKPEKPDISDSAKPENPNTADNTNPGNLDVTDNNTPENPGVADDIIPETPDIIVPGESDNTYDDQFDDRNGEDNSEDFDEWAAVGDEIIAGDVIYTVTKINGTPCVEYTEAIDEDVRSVIIPDKIMVDGVTYQVTAVAPKAFYKNTALKKLTVGKYVIQIGNQAFYGCTSLKKVVINSKKIKNGGIGFKAFAKIAKGAKLYVPKAKYKSYKKMLKRAGVGTKVKIYKR